MREGEVKLGHCTHELCYELGILVQRSFRCDDPLPNYFTVTQVSDEMDGIRKGLSQLREGFSPHDSQQQVIDTLEQNISEMMSQLMDRSSSPSGKRTQRRHVRKCS